LRKFPRLVASMLWLRQQTVRALMPDAPLQLRPQQQPRGCDLSACEHRFLNQMIHAVRHGLRMLQKIPLPWGSLLMAAELQPWWASQPLHSANAAFRSCAMH
jgi:hypothetical protein